MDIDNADANKSTEEDFLSDKVIFGTYTFLQRHALDSWQHFSSVLQVEKLKELSKLPDIYDRLTRSLAPNIWELDDVKKGLLCQVILWNICMSFRKFVL